jgi:hypothetical protein
VGLVDGQENRRGLGQHREHVVAGQLLRGQEDKPGPAAAQQRETPGALAGPGRGVHGEGRQPALA